MAFPEKMELLQSLYRQQHDLSNRIAGANFADEKGHLPENERKELEQLQEVYQQQEIKEIALREEIKKEFPEAYALYLTEQQKKLIQIQNHLAKMTGEIDFKHSFNKTLCESLLSDLNKIIQNKKAKYDFNWLFDVSSRLIEAYKTDLIL